MNYQPIMDEIKRTLKTCRECGKEVARNNKTGLCKACSHKARQKLCQKCKKNYLGKHNKSGYCAECYRGMWRELNAKKQARYYSHNYSSYRKPKKQKDGKDGQCRLCDKRFYLEEWQHKSLHWCPACRRSPVYQDYASYEKRANHLGLGG